MRRFFFFIFMVIWGMSVFAGPYEDSRRAGIEAFKKGEYEYALKCFESVLEIAPPDNDLREWIARCRAALSKPNQNSSNIIYDPILGINFVRVKAGTFMMGATKDDLHSRANQMPAHRVTLTKDYCIGETEVTQALWKKFMKTNPSYFKGNDLPVANVSFEEITEFIDKINCELPKDCKPYRLPTEAEWEYAARGGHKMTNTIYAGSDNIMEVTSNESYTTYKLNPPKRWKPNELGIYDMSGNVAEVTADWYGKYSKESVQNPCVDKAHSAGEGHVYRGGDNAQNAYMCTVYYRNVFFEKRDYYLGFRLCRDWAPSDFKLDRE